MYTRMFTVLSDILTMCLVKFPNTSKTFHWAIFNENEGYLKQEFCQNSSLNLPPWSKVHDSKTYISKFPIKRNAT